MLCCLWTYGAAAKFGNVVNNFKWFRQWFDFFLIRFLYNRSSSWRLRRWPARLCSVSWWRYYKRIWATLRHGRGSALFTQLHRWNLRVMQLMRQQQADPIRWVARLGQAGERTEPLLSECPEETIKLTWIMSRCYFCWHGDYFCGRHGSNPFSHLSSCRPSSLCAHLHVVHMLILIAATPPTQRAHILLKISN